MTYLFDSNLVRAFLNHHLLVLKNLDRKVEQGHEIALPSIVVAEQMRGRYDALCKADAQNFLMEQTRWLETEAVIRFFRTIYLTDAGVTHWERMAQRVQLKKRHNDAIVAATALAHNAVVVTRNTKDFRDLLPADKLENWIDLLY